MFRQEATLLSQRDDEKNMIKHWKHTTDSTDAAVLKSELLDDLKSDLIQAIRNNNPMKIARIKRDIEVVEKWKV